MHSDACGNRDRACLCVEIDQKKFFSMDQNIYTTVIGTLASFFMVALGLAPCRRNHLTMCRVEEHPAAQRSGVAPALVHASMGWPA